MIHLQQQICADADIALFYTDTAYSNINPRCDL